MDVLTEIDRLKVQLLRERQARLQAEGAGLQMAQRAFQAQVQAAEAESRVLHEAFKVAYNLGPGDEITEAGIIKRAAVRSLSTVEGG